MSKISGAIKKRGEISKKVRLERQNEISDLRNLSIYTAKLHESLKNQIEPILDRDNVQYVTIEIPMKLLSYFMVAMYREEFYIYNIIQVKGTENEFEISRKEILF